MLRTESAISRPTAARRTPQFRLSRGAGRPLNHHLLELGQDGGAAPEGAAAGAAEVLLFDRRMEAADWPFPVGACAPEHVL